MTLDELVKVHAKKLGRNTQMAAEVEALRKIDHAMLVLRILHIMSVYKLPKAYKVD